MITKMPLCSSSAENRGVNQSLTGLPDKKLINVLFQEMILKHKIDGSLWKSLRHQRALSDHPAPEIFKVADLCRQVLGPAVYARPAVLIRQRPQQGCTARKPLLSNCLSNPQRSERKSLHFSLYVIAMIAEIRGSAAL